MKRILAGVAMSCVMSATQVFAKLTPPEQVILTSARSTLMSVLKIRGKLMRYWQILILGLALAGTAACSKPDPAVQCGIPESQKAYVDSFFSSVAEAKERDETSIVGEKALKQVHAMMEAFKKTNPISFGAITADRYDAATGNIDCQVEINLKPSGDFASESVQDQAHEMEKFRSTPIFPVGFFERRSAPITTMFELRRSADGKHIVKGGGGFKELTGLAYELLSAKSLSDASLAANPGSNPNFKPIDPGAQVLPTVGQCFDTTVHDTGPRLEGVPDSGTSVTFEDGHSMVDYYVSASASKWIPGDPVRLCVVELPTDCPKDDNRGVLYKATNIRTKNDWTAADSEHECGGA